MMYHLIMADVDKAADCWEKAVEQRDPFVVLAPRMAFAAPLRRSPRWLDLSKRLNLPEESSYAGRV